MSFSSALLCVNSFHGLSVKYQNWNFFQLLQIYLIYINKNNEYMLFVYENLWWDLSAHYTTERVSASRDEWHINTSVFYRCYLKITITINYFISRVAVIEVTVYISVLRLTSVVSTSGRQVASNCLGTGVILIWWGNWWWKFLFTFWSRHPTISSRTS